MSPKRDDVQPSDLTFRLETRRLGRGARVLLLCIGAGFFLGFLGPYGSYMNAGLIRRVFYWTCCALSGLGLCVGPILLARQKGLLQTKQCHWLGVLAALMLVIALVSLAQTALTRGLANLIWPQIAPSLPGWWLWYGQVLLIALPSSLMAILWVRYRDDHVHDHSLYRGGTVDAANSEPISRKNDASHIDMSYPLPASILALQMEDHYIRCHYLSGSRLIHGALRDAISRQSACDGLQVHRSWWVARKAISCWKGDARSLRLHLSNGLVVPVARSQVLRLREAGWLTEKTMDT